MLCGPQQAGEGSHWGDSLRNMGMQEKKRSRNTGPRWGKGSRSGNSLLQEHDWGSVQAAGAGVWRLAQTERWRRLEGGAWRL